MINIPLHKLRLFPVIHVQGSDYDGTYEEYLNAISNGASGVFIISHDTKKCNAEKLNIHLATIMDFPHPSAVIGVNALDVPAREMHSKFPRAQAIWCDDIGCYGDYTEPAIVRASIPDDVELFGSVAFKYQPHPASIEYATTIAARFTTSITTSGPETGSPPDAEKLMGMRAYAGLDGRLAIASGVTCDNVLDFVHMGVSDFLVSTGISKDFHHLDEDKVYNMSLLLRCVSDSNGIRISVRWLDDADRAKAKSAGLVVNRRASGDKVYGQLSNAEHRKLISAYAQKYDSANI